jgi:glucuronokinase
VVVYEWHELEILPPPDDGTRFSSLEHLAVDVSRNGYYGALRLIKASLKRFHDYCVEANVKLPDQQFSLRYSTNVPRGVGLAGSSAIITATFRALQKFYGVDIPLPILPNWVRSVEREELRIEGGLQDRVAQVYGGVTYMDFDRALLERDGHGFYESLDPIHLPPLYMAYQTELAEPSDVVHNDLRARYDAGDRAVHAAMDELADITLAARGAIASGDAEELARQFDLNFDVRRRIMNVAKGHLAMVETARRCGASANFAGSGGAIVGTFDGTDAGFARLKEGLVGIGCKVIRPRIA